MMMMMMMMMTMMTIIMIIVYKKNIKMLQGWVTNNVLPYPLGGVAMFVDPVVQRMDNVIN